MPGLRGAARDVVGGEACRVRSGESASERLNAWASRSSTGASRGQTLAAALAAAVA